jgi:hypothetical protein
MSATKIPRDWPVQPITPTLDQTTGLTQCWTCGRYWDDSKPTSLTPAPAARCPFEYFHEDVEPCLDPANFVLKLVEIPVCLACDDDDHHTCYGGLCRCPCGGEET